MRNSVIVSVLFAGCFGGMAWAGEQQSRAATNAPVAEAFSVGSGIYLAQVAVYFSAQAPKTIPELCTDAVEKLRHEGVVLSTNTQAQVEIVLGPTNSTCRVNFMTAMGKPCYGVVFHSNGEASIWSGIAQEGEPPRGLDPFQAIPGLREAMEAQTRSTGASHGTNQPPPK